MGGNRKLDSGFRVKCLQEFTEPNASAPKVQLQIIRLCLAVIAFRKWDFGVMDVSRAFLRPGPLKRETYVQLPKGVEDDRVSWKLSKPLYGLSTSCKDWYKAIRDFLSEECVCVCVWGG